MPLHYFQALLFAVALSIDAFVACFVYGTSRVRIPTVSLLILSFISAGTLFASLLLGGGIRSLLPSAITHALSFVILFFLGLVKLSDSTLKHFIQCTAPKNLRFSLLNLQFILTVYADPAQVNQEDQEILSPREAFPLGLALSLDSAAAGIGAGAASLPFIPTAFLSFICTLGAVTAGSLLGRRLSHHFSLDLSWLCGLLLMGLALLKL